MSRVIPLSAVPNQSLTVTLDNERLALVIKEASGVMVADFERNGETILLGTRVLAGEPIIPYRYLESGNFIMLTLNDELPDWRQFETTQTLIYLTIAEVDALHG